MSEPIYLDFNATTPVAPEVIEAMLPHFGERFGNPSSTHPFGRRARDAVERARAQVAELIGCDPSEVVFTSGGTEANNLAIFGTLAANSAFVRFVTSTVEHPATSHPGRVLCERGVAVTFLGVDRFGRVVPADLEAHVRAGPALVSVMHAQNETGTLQPIAELAAIAHQSGAVVHTDAAQSVGKVPVRVAELDVDLLSIAGHKLYAPPGIGALYVRRGHPISAVTFGAGHEGGVRPGTENVPGMVALGAACELAGRRLASDLERMQDLTRRMLERLERAIVGLTQNGHPSERLPNTLNLSFPGVRGADLLAAAPTVMASTGSACHDASVHPSAVLAAMGVPVESAHGAVRLSLGRTTREADVDRAADALIQAYRERAARTKQTGQTRGTP